ncbi:DNA methyltransferase [Lentzea sp. NPDC003310]|uniref:Eco57I restriction-modification methylase domain-containing protein n=1 Tax=Lentzea sp. NPDC003310 TaxID=3154447 RepID=UPI0033A0CB9A
MLKRISEGKDVKGSLPVDYRVIGSRSVRDDAERRWDYLKAVWAELRERLPRVPEPETPADPTGVAITQWLEPLFAELGFGELTSLGTSGIASDDGSKTFAISHRWNHVPVHLAAWNTLLDKRPGGAGTVPPQSLVQECLNRTDTHLWGVVSNGRQLRLLRDSNALATASYVEFDLEAIFDGELFSEFVLLYRLLHVTRFKVDEGGAPSACWLETWRVEAIDSGVRALHNQRNGVKQAITRLGTGFLKHPDNGELRRNLDVQAFHGSLLRLVYRLIFLFVAEERDLLHLPEASAEARRRYANYFSSARLRHQASRRRGTSHSDLYQALHVVLDALGDENGRPELGLPGLGGLFDDTEADDPLRGLSLANADLLDAVRHLSRVRDGDSGRLRRVDYRHMGAEELGSIYESLLELVPKHSAVDRTFELIDRLGNDRKKTGSYYTPSSLIETLLDSTLDPVIDDAQKRGEQKASAAGTPDPAGHIVAELLSLTVCDPACGSGHFLVAAARRIAKRVAAVRENNPEPTIDAVRHALHEVIARCIYGVDLNPMAVELAKVSLWLEALEPGKPLGFLDAHVKHGNGLIGATPALLRDGIPNKAFKSVEGDDPKHAASLEKQNDKERKGQIGLFERTVETKVANTSFAAGLRRITDAPSGNLAEVHRQAADYQEWEASAEYSNARHVADAWCAAFVWRKTKDAPTAITHDVFLALQDLTATAASQATHDEIVRLRDEYRFFHWHLAFPDVFTVPDDGSGVDPATGWAGGFSCVLGNPPWDEVAFAEKEYFSTVEPSIAATAGAARRTRIAEWLEENPSAGEVYLDERRKVKSTFLFAGSSGAFPLCGKGLSVKGVTVLQTDHLFAERFVSIMAPEGRAGGIIPTSIATGAGAQYLFGDIARRGAISVLYDFENRKPLFFGVHTSYKFCLLSLVGRALREPAASLAFFLADAVDLDDEDRVFELSPEEISLISPNTGSLPIFRRRRDADLTAAVYHRVPVIWTGGKGDGNPWRVDFVPTPFHLTDDSDLFRTRDQLEADGWTLMGNIFVRGGERMLPLYEAKMMHHFDHRWSSFNGTGNEDRSRLSIAEKRDPSILPYSRYWVQDIGLITTTRKGKEVEVPGVAMRLDDLGWDRDWLCGWRDVTNATNERTAIPAFLPRSAVGNTYPLMLVRVSPALTACLIATQSSLIFDFIGRQKVGGIHMGLMVWKQLPVPPPRALERHSVFIALRVLELVYTAYDMAGLARDLGDSGPPFRWDEERRARIRAELDAYFFHLYGIDRPDVEYILETFQSDSGGGLKNNEISKYGRYRTKDFVLEEYDRMAPVGVDLDVPLIDGENYTSKLDPPPGHGRRHPAADGGME